MRPRSIAGRVALAAGTSVALGGLAVAIVAGALADRFAREREDAQLRGAARTLAVELLEGGDVDWIAADETRELEHTGMRVAIYDGRRFVAGDGEIGPVAAGACADTGARRACGVAAGPLVAVAARNREAVAGQLEAFTLASLLAVVIVGLFGALVAGRVARISVAPLARLREAVEEVREDEPSAPALGPTEGVAEVDALRESLASLLSRLSTALAASRRFATEAAHELRTPLTTILGELELAAESAEKAEVRDSIERARRTAARLATLVERLLVLARPPARLAGEMVDLVEIAEDAIDAFGLEQRDRVALRVRGSAPIEGDRALLVAMASNAIENALKHSTGRVTVEVAADEAGASIRVDDEGPGVRPEERERVFEAFYRTRESRASGVSGHGIGLALIAYVAALHGGAARFSDTSGGARLEMIFPPFPSTRCAERGVSRPSRGSG